MTSRDDSPVNSSRTLSYAHHAQFGAIGGLAFALLYSVLGVPLAILADRGSRSGVITGALFAVRSVRRDSVADAAG